MTETTQFNDILHYHGSCIAVLSDIHSNACALEACLEDAKSAGADCFVFLGDYISGLADSIKVMDLVYEIQDKYPTCCIRGNRERYILDHRKGVNICVPGSHTGTFLFTSNQLREKDIQFFEELPIYKKIRINGAVLELAHAIKDNDRYYFDKEDGKIDAVIGQLQSDYLLCGHSHKPYEYHGAGKVIINPGSVGLPQGADHRAQYLLLKIEDGKVCCDFRQVAYDMEAVIRDQFQSGLVQVGKYWAISDLYGAMTGEEYTKMLLQKIYKCAEDNPQALSDENIWKTCAASLGMCFTEEEVLAAWRANKNH